MKVINVTDFEKKLNKFKAKKINLNDDYEYFVRIGLNGKRCHLSKEDKSIKKLSKNIIKCSDNYLCYVIDVNNKAGDFVKKKINCFYKVLILVKVDNNIIIDYAIFFPIIDDDLSKKIRSELLYE